MGTEARARLALLALIGVTLFSFTLLFGAADYPGPPLLGGLIAAGLAVAARRLGFSTPLTLLLSTVGLVWYVSLVFQAGNTLAGLPSPGALEGVVDQVTRGLESSSIDYAPVPLRPGYVIMVVAAVWVAATIGELATFRWRRPLVASFLPVVMLSFLLVLGTGDNAPLLIALFLAALLSFWSLESTHRLRSWGRWVTAIARRTGRDEVPEVTGRLARRMGISCIAAALVAPMFLPALSQGLLEWRTGLGGGPGPTGDGGTSIDPFVSLVPELIQMNDEELFEARVTQGPDRPHYWRLQTLTQFDGERWLPGPLPSNPLDESFLDAPPSGEQMTVTFTIDTLTSNYLPAPANPSSVSLSNDSLARTQDQLRYDPVSRDLAVEGGLTYSLTYRVSAPLAQPSPAALRDAQPGGLPPDDPNQVPTLSAEVRALRDRWTEGAANPFEQLLAIQNRLREDYAYDTQVGIDEGDEDDYLSRFLLEDRRGYCQQFATAFALLSRSLGYNTRVVIGFLPGTEASDTSGAYRQVASADTHAWPEVFFEGLGWVRFEPTPRDDQGATARYPDGAAGGPAGGGRNDNTRQGGQGDRSGRQPVRDPQAFVPGEITPVDTDSVPQPEEPAWQQTFTRITLLILLATVAFLASVPALKTMRTRRRYRRASSGRARAAAAFQEFVDEAGELAAPRRAAESAVAYAARVAQLRRLPQREAETLARIYDAAEYGAGDLAQPQADEARRLTRELRGRLWAHASWWNRMTRLFSPRGLDLRQLLRGGV